MINYYYRVRLMREENNSINKNNYISGSGRRFGADTDEVFSYTSFETKKLLRSYAPQPCADIVAGGARNISLEPHAVLNRGRITLSFNISDGSTPRSYVLKDILSFLLSVRNREAVSYGKHLSFVHDISVFTMQSQKIIRFLTAYFRERQLGDALLSPSDGSSISYTYAKGHSKQIELAGHEIDMFLSSISGLYFLNTDFRSRYHEERYLEISADFPPIELSIEKTKRGISFEASAFTLFEGQSKIYFERRKKLHVVDGESAESVLPFLRFLCARRTENELFISEKDLTLFSTGLFPVLEQYFNINSEGFEVSRYLPQVPSFEFYIDMPVDDELTCDIHAIYRESSGDKKMLRILADDDSEDDGIRRDLYQESRIAGELASYFDDVDKDRGLLVISGRDNNNDRIYSFISEDIFSLEQLGRVYLSDSIKSVRITSAPRVTLGVSVESDLLQLSIVPQEMSLKELDEILSRYDRKRKFYRLSNGDILKLRSEDMELLYSLKDGLGLSSKDILEGHAAIPKYRAMFVNDLSEKSSDYEYARLVRGGDFKMLVSSFVETDSASFEIPASLESVLRDYQKTGFKWLMSLKANSFGGILADDMGLGKTLQVLAMLLYLKEISAAAGRKNCCSLIVCPASLVYNWQHEIKKFTKELNCDLAVGIKPDRVRVTSEIDEEKTDVIITSYDLLRRDTDLYKYLNFECLIIDEAQFIKNPTTQIARAVKSISASFKVALTGTPIENRLSELWSIFDFCMPGYLFSYKGFKENLEIPAISDGDERAMQRLKRMIAPFILRRLKKDVLKDLPDKLEENIITRMTKGQQDLYNALIQKVRLLVDSKNDKEIDRDRITILSELTRLRQICCDPGLIYEGYDGGSAKADLCIEMIKSAAESGHKVLLFSQFTSMLERLCVLLKKEDISYYLLTGSTKKEDRIRMVEAFQEDDTNVFCISLKAGGTGLNLTAADIVIHFDHWWNVAVENQATDRAHRIGQKNVVTVYRIIMQNTIEERIIQLQNRKKELSDQLLNTGALGAPALNKEELLELLG